MNFIQKYFPLILFVFATVICKAGAKKPDTLLVIKVTYEDGSIEHAPVAFALIDAGKLNDFKIKDDPISNLPNIIYNLTYNGGYYISESFVGLYTMGCCNYGNVNEAVTKLMDSTLSKTELSSFKHVDSLSLNLLENRHACHFSFKKGKSVYSIEMWHAELDYCVCDLYIESPHQKIFGNKAAYIKEIKSVKKPDKKTARKLKMLLQQMVEVDSKHQ